MSDYSPYLYQAQVGKHERWRFRLMIVIMIVGGLVIKYALEYLLTRMGVADEIMSRLLGSRMIEQIGAAGLLILLIKPIHGRSISSVFNAVGVIRWKRLGVTIALSAVLMFVLATSLIYLVHDQGLIWQWESSEQDDFFPFYLITLPFHVFTFIFIFYGYVMQELTVHSRKPSRAIWGAFLLYIVVFYSGLFSLIFGGSGLDFPWKWIFNGGLVVTLLLFFMVVLDDGLETVFGYKVGTFLFPLLVDINAMDEKVTGSQSSNIYNESWFFEGYVHFFTNDWGAILLLLLFYFIIRKRFALLPLRVIWQAIPPLKPAGEAYDLIEEIGKTEE